MFASPVIVVCGVFFLCCRAGNIYAIICDSHSGYTGWYEENTPFVQRASGEVVVYHHPVKDSQFVINQHRKQWSFMGGSDAFPSEEGTFDGDVPFVNSSTLFAQFVRLDASEKATIMSRVTSKIQWDRSTRAASRTRCVMCSNCVM